MSCRARRRFELLRAVSRRHDVARSSKRLLRNQKSLEKLLIIGSARSSAPRVAKNVAEGGETVREIVKPKSRRVSGGSRCGGLRASQRGFPSNILSTRPLLGIYHLSSLGCSCTNIPCKGYGACEYTTSRLCLHTLQLHASRESRVLPDRHQPSLESFSIYIRPSAFAGK